MDWPSLIKDIILVILGGGGFKFVEYLIEHRTQVRNRKEDREDTTDKKLSDLKQFAIDHLDESNALWKEKYCNRNANAISELTYVSKELKDNVILLTNTMAEMKEYNQNVGGAVTGIIHDRIIHNVDDYFDRGGITIKEISTLKSMYYPYKKLGGNGDVETAFERATNGTILPVITDEEAIRRDILIKRKKVYGDDGTTQ